MPERYNPAEVNWEHGFDKVNYQSVTSHTHMSDERDKIVRDALRAREEPESMQLGKVLRKSHIQLSHRADLQPANTESKSRFIKRPAEMAQSFSDANGAELRATHIDLAVAGSKSMKDEHSVLKNSMSQGSDQKWACAKPHGFEELGAELRKSNVLLHAGRHDFRTTALPVHQSETKLQYPEKPICAEVGFGATLGKQLRTSSIDVSYGVPKTCTDWQSAQHAMLGDNMKSKWACKKPEGFYHLIAELRKTNVTLGTDKIDYGTRQKVIKDGRDARAAGADRGL